MRRLLTIVLVGLLTLAAAHGTSGAADVKIGVIDTHRIMRDSKAAKKVREILLKDMESKRERFRYEEEQTLKLQEEIKRDAQTMNPAVRQEKTEKFERELKELSRLKSDLEEDFRKKEAELTRKILKEVGRIVNDFRKKEKYTIILEKRYVVAAEDAIEVTEKIINLYDAAK